MSLADAALFRATGHGSFFAWVEGVERDIEVTGSFSSTRSHNTFYPRSVIETKIRINLAFKNSTERNKFNDWMIEYQKKLSADRVGPMQITVPAIKFSAWGVPVSDLEFGSSQPSSVKHVPYEFEILDQRQTPKNPVLLPSDPTAKRFYPTGIQSSEGTMLYSEEELAYNEAMGALESVLAPASTLPNGTQTGTIGYYGD
jgi:hypothetical protein